MSQKPELILEETKLHSLYLYEVWWLANSIKKKAEKLFADTPIPDDGFSLQVDPDLHSLIASLLSDAAALRRFTHSPSSKGKDESGRQFRLRKARVRLLNDALKDLSLSEILDSKVRNTLEHFDEYLDGANISVTESKDPGLVMAAYNIIISHWEVTTPRLYPIRLYVSSERKFYNMKWSVDIGLIHSESLLIIDRVGVIGGYGEDAPGGLMLRL